MLCFVMPQVHAQNGSHTAACKGNRKQGMFCNPPPMFLGAPLIRPHQTKSHEIDNNQIYKCNFHSNIIAPRRVVVQHSLL